MSHDTRQKIQSKLSIFAAPRSKMLGALALLLFGMASLAAPYKPLGQEKFTAFAKLPGLASLISWQNDGQVEAVNPRPVVAVSAASYKALEMAPGSIASAFGTLLATTTAIGADTDPVAAGIQLPKTLGGTVVKVGGVTADLFFVSPTQINFLIPTSLLSGTYAIEVTSSDATISNGTFTLQAAVASIFTVDQSGVGAPSAQVQRVKIDNTQTFENLSTIEQGTGRIFTSPIDLGPVGERVFLLLYTTGLRNAPDPNNDKNANESVRVIINDNVLTPAYAGPQGFFVGVDQINIELPRTLLGTGNLDIAVTIAGGPPSNTTTLPINAPALTSLALTPSGLAGRVIRGFASIDNLLFSATNQGLSRSADYGANWTSIGGALPGTDILAVFAGGARLYVSVSGFGIFYSDDFGANWTAFNTGLTGANLTINSIYAIGPVLYLATQGGVCTFNGATWVPLNLGLDSQTQTSTILGFAAAPGIGFFAATRGGVCIYNTAQQRWQAATTGFPANAYGTVLSYNTTSLFAGTNGFGVCRYNGSSWVAVNNGLPANANILSLISVGTRLLAGTAGNGTYVSNDNGDTWTPYTTDPVASVITSLYVYRGRLCVGTSGGVYGGRIVTPAGNRAPVAFAATLGTRQNVALPLTLQANDADLDALTYQFTNPANGTLSGFAPRLIYTPNNNFTGNDSFTFKANDGALDSTTVTVAIAVTGTPVNRAPVVSVPGAQTVVVGQPLSFVVGGSDPDVGQILTLSAANVPANALFNPTTGQFTWTPTAAQVGSFIVSFTVTDNGSPQLSDTKTVTITVPNRAPTITVPGPQSTSTGQLITFAVSATDPDTNQTVTLSATNLPSGATFTAATGVFTWTPSAIGISTVTFTATDNGNPPLSDTKTVNISVLGNSPNGFWTHGGGTYTGSPSSILLDGSDIFVGASTGVYRTSDNGATFTTLNNGLVSATNITGLSLVDTTFYAGTTLGLYKSTDRGVNWTKVTANGVSPSIYAVVKLGTTLIAATPSNGLFYSTDGITWTVAPNTGFNILGSTRNLIVKGNRAFVGCDKSIFSSTDGINWTALDTRIGGTGIVRGAASLAVKGNLLYLLDSEGLKVSVDDGRNWVLLNTDPILFVTNLNINKLYVGGNGLFTTNSSYFYYSPDGGLSFIQMNTGDVPTTNFVFPAYVATSSTIFSAADKGSVTNKPGVLYSPFPNITANRAPSISVTGTASGTTGSPINLTFSATDPDAGQTITLASVALPNGATFTPATGAFAWTPNTPGTYTVLISAKDNGTPVLGDLKVVTITVTGPALVGNWSATTSLPSNLPVSALAASGTNLFAGSTQGVFLSTDNGATWTASNTGLAASRSISALVTIGANLYASTSDGLYVSNNNAANWTKISTGITGTVLDVASNGTNLYAVTASAVFISTDNGANWRQTAAQSLINGKTLAVVGNTVLANGQNVGIMRSTDGGSNWQSVTLSQTFTVVTSLATNGATFFAGASDGIYRSTNGGQAWTKLTTGLPANSCCWKLIVNNDQIFAVMNPASGSVVVYFSTDNGATWRAMDAGAPPNDNTGGNPTLAAANNFLYYGSTSAGVFKSPFPLYPTNTAPALTVPAAQTVPAGQNLTFTISATDADAGQTVTLSAANLPLGASFVPSTGRFNWTPGIAGTFVVGFTTVDNGTPALSSTKTVTITVGAPVTSPNGFWQSGNTGLEGVNPTSLVASGANVYAGSSTGLYRSTNGGASWTKFTNTGLPVGATEILGVNGTKLYAYANGEVYRSNDSGANWTKIQTGLPTFANFNQLHIANGYLFLGGGNATGIYRSSDDGANWTRVYAPNGGSAIASAFTNIGNTIFAIVNAVVLRGTDNGASWTATGTLNGVYSITTNGAILFAGTTQGVSRSTDNGATWTAINTGLPANSFVIAMQAANNIIYAAVNNGGMYFSTNNGGNWSAMDSGDAPTTALFLALGDRLFAANTNRVVYASALPAITGNTIPTLNVPATQNATTTQALNFTVTASDPDSGQTVTLSAAGLPTGATFNAANGQFSWTPNAPATVTVSFTATDNGAPALSNTKIVTIIATGISPAGNWTNISGGLPSGPQSLVALGNEIFVGTTSHGVYKSADGGQTWVASNTGMGNVAVISLSEINGLLYAGANGLYTSNDGGASWTLINTGVGGQVSSVVQIGTRLLAATNVGVYSSTNNGTSWSASSTGLPASQQTRALVVKGTEVYVSAGSTGTVYKSTDNGVNWAIANTGLPGSQPVNALAVNGTTLYAMTGAGVYSSTNSGANWAVVGGGLPTTNNNAQAMAVSGNNLFVGYFFGTQVYASTNNGTNWAAMNVGASVSYVRGIAVIGNKVYCWATPDGFTTGIYVSPVPGT